MSGGSSPFLREKTSMLKAETRIQGLLCVEDYIRFPANPHFEQAMPIDEFMVPYSLLICSFVYISNKLESSTPAALPIPYLRV